MTPRLGKWLKISYVPLGRPSTPVAIVLYLPDNNDIYFRFRDRIPAAANEDDQLVLLDMGDTFRAMLAHHGAGQAFEWMGSSLSNVIRSEGPFEIATADPESTIDDIFLSHVGLSSVRR